MKPQECAARIWLCWSIPSLEAANMAGGVVKGAVEKELRDAVAPAIQKKWIHNPELHFTDIEPSTAKMLEVMDRAIEELNDANKAAGIAARFQLASERYEKTVTQFGAVHYLYVDGHQVCSCQIDMMKAVLDADGILGPWAPWTIPVKQLTLRFWIAFMWEN